MTEECEHVWVTYWSIGKNGKKQCIDCLKIVDATDKDGVTAMTKHKRHSGISKPEQQ